MIHIPVGCYQPHDRDQPWGADDLRPVLGRGIVLNTVNPGPVNTGYLDADTTDRDLTEVNQVIEATPFRRFGAPDDPARLIGWLVSDAGRWVVGQVIKSDGGCDLWR